MSTGHIILLVAVCAAVTYLARMIPFAAFTSKVKSPFINDCLYYAPYAVLAAMTVPQIFYSTGSLESALAGTVAAFALAFFKKPLIVVAAGAALTAYICSLIISII